MSEIEQLKGAIAALEAQRAILGDAVVDAALASMREKLALLEPQPVSEQRKLVTVLFADLVGFTALAEKLDAEDVREVLNAYFSRWTACIERYGGKVEKFIGDAVMAVFGLSITHEDDPESAVRAALDMRPALAELNAALERDQGLKLAIRVGIHTGPVVVSMLGERHKRSDGQDFVVVGDTVNLASRLQSAAPEDGILISHDTYRHVRGIFSVQVLDPIYVKGKAQPVQVYVVLRAKQRAFRVTTRGVEGIETRMIGRQAELKRLQDALDAVKQNSELQVVTVVAEAGIGKSRLIYEFDNWLELLPEVVTYFKGRASPSMQKLAYSLLRDLFTFRFQIQDSDPPQVVRRKMEQGFAQAYRLSSPPSADGSTSNELERGGASSPENIQPDPIRPETIRADFAGRLLGFDLGPMQNEPGTELQGNDGQATTGRGDQAREFYDRALSYLSDYIKTLAVRRPVVWLLEDIHWADESSLDMIEYLAETLSDQQVLIVCAARPALFERRPHWVERLADRCLHTRLDLSPLTRQESRSLVAEILQKVDEVPASLQQLVANHAEGNPFYVEELIKMLIEDGVIVKGEERWRVELERLESIRVPPTLTEILQARLDSLQPLERDLLQRAAVVGRTFWDQAVRYLDHQARDARQVAGPQDLWSGLSAREMIFQREQSTFEETREYVFKHSLLRDVTYEGLLKRQRRMYHASAAQWLVEITRRSQRADEYAALIADHFERAGETRSATEWHSRAARQAAAQFANSEALHHFAQALELMPESEILQRFELLLAREKVYDLIGERPLQALDLQTISELALSLDAGARAEALLRQSHYSEATGDYQEAAKAAQRAIDLAVVAGLGDKSARGYLLLGVAFWRQSEYTAARGPLQQALSLAREFHLPVIEAESQRVLGILAESLGDYADARNYYEASNRIYHGLGDLRGESATLNDLGVVVFNEGNYAAARDYYQQSRRLKREIGDRRGESSTLNNLGMVAYYQGDPLEAYQYFDEALRICQKTGDREGESAALGGLGAVAHYRGDLHAAKDYHEESLRLSREIGDRQGEVIELSYIGLLYHLAGENETAEQYIDQALRIAQELGTQRELAYALTYQGHVLLSLGRLDNAAEAYRQAADLRRELGEHNLAAESISGLARAYLAQGDLFRAREFVDEILAYLDGSGINPLDGTDDPFQIYLTCFRVLHLSHDPRAMTVLEGAYQLLQERASRIEDDALRRSFLENIPSRRELSLAYHENCYTARPESD